MVLWVFLDKITEQIKQKRDWRTGPWGILRLEISKNN